MILTALRTQIKWILGLFIVIFTLSIGFMYGTGRSGGGSSSRSGDFVVAKVNGEELHISTLQQQLRSFVERNGIRDLSDKQMPVIYKAVFDEMIANKAVIDEVTRLKIGADPADVNARLKQIELRYVTKEAFMQALKAQGSSIEQARASLARQLAIEKMLSDASGGATVNDEETNELYEALKPNFTLPAGIDADFAYFKDKAAAEAFAAAVAADGDWDKAVAGAGDSLVRATLEGETERIGASEMSGKLEPVAALNDGELSGVLEIAADNYFVIRRVTAAPETVRPLEEVSDALKDMILQTKRAQLQQDFIKELTDKMKIEVLTPDLFAVAEAPAVPASGAAGGISELSAAKAE